METTEQEKVLLEKTRHSLNGHKGHKTRIIRELEKLVDFIHANPTARGLEQLKETVERFKIQSGRVEELYIELLELDPDVAKQKSYSEELDALSQERTKVLTNTLLIMANAERATQNVPPQSAQSGARKPKICESLRPHKLEGDHNPAELRSWLEQFQAFYTTSGLDQYSLHEQHMFLFNCISTELAVRIKENELFGANVPIYATNGPSVGSILAQEFMRQYPLFIRRLEFFRYTQGPNQEFNDFMVKLKQKGDEADLHKMGVDELYVFRYLTGVTDITLRDRMLKLENPTLEDLKRTARRYEISKCSAKAMEDKPTKVAQTVSKNSRPPGGSNTQSGQQKNRQNQNRVRIPEELRGKCLRCGITGHLIKDCFKKPTVKCNGCGGTGHLQVACMKQFNQKSTKERVKATSDGASSGTPPPDEDDSTSGSEDEEVNRISKTVCSKVSQATPRLPIKFKTLTEPRIRFRYPTTPDTGATRTVIASNVAKKFGVPLVASKARIVAANGSPMPCDGKVKLQARVRKGRIKKRTIVNALVTSAINDEILVSWHDLQSLGIISSQFPEVSTTVEEVTVKGCSDSRVDTLEAIKVEFDDVLCDKLEAGKVMKGPAMTIHLRSDIPVVPKKKLTTRKIPLHWEKEANAVISDLLEKGIIRPVEQPTEWISLGHFVPKEGGKAGLRLVTDYVDLNKFVQRPVHPFPCTQDILKGIEPGSKWFAKMDAAQGYFQIPLDEESSLLTTFLLPTGRYCYTRAPMGLSASGDEWCQRSDLALQGLPGCSKLVDDILIQATTKEELFNRIRAVLSRCRSHGITISRRKLSFGQEVKFAGHVIGIHGVKPDPARLEAITKFPTPKDVADVRAFLGLANQLGHFLPDLSQATTRMRNLLKKNTAFIWLHEHEQEFQKAKEILVSDAVVKPFDPTLQTFLLTDASRLYGLGFVLMQKEVSGTSRLVACGSCSLTPTQSRYATIELECLGMQYAVEKCQFWLKGLRQQFTIITDHRPLLGIFSKPLHAIDNPRLQRIRSKLDGAGYVFTVEWAAGKTHLIADALSRAPVFQAMDMGDGEEESDRLVSVQAIIEEKLQFVRSAAKDPSYRAVLEVLKSDISVASLPPMHPARQFQSVWDRFSILDEDLILYEGSRIFIPMNARGRILQLMHLSHAGIVKTRKLAQQHYYWPGMMNDIKLMIEKCDVCQIELPSQAKEPALPNCPAEYPMDALGVDLCDVKGSTWLIMVDRFSGFPFAHRLRSLTTAVVTRQLLKWFEDWGFPRTIRSDGGPQFRSEFSQFCGRFDIRHEVSSPYNPSSNGLAESAVKNVKKLIKKTAPSEFGLALLEFRNVPRADGSSPAQLFLCRRQRTRLPVLPSALNVTPLKDMVVTRRRHQLDESARLDVHKTPLKLLDIGDEVRIQDTLSGLWKGFGVIKDVRENGRSYVVRTQEGKEILRNRRFLRPLRQPSPQESQSAQSSHSPESARLPRRSLRLAS